MKYQVLEGAQTHSVPADWCQPGIGVVCLTLSGTARVAGKVGHRSLEACMMLGLDAVEVESIETTGGRTVLLALEKALPRPVGPWPTLFDEGTAILLQDLFFEGVLPDDHLDAGLNYLVYRLAQRGRPGDATQQTDPGYRIRTYLQEHLDEALTLEQLASDFSLSPVGMIRYARKHTGQSPMKLLAGMRIVRAKQLLEQTDLTVTQIAHAVGYADPAAFSHFYKRNTGQSPRAFRADCRWLV